MARVRPSRRCLVAALRADAVKVRRPRASGVEAERRTLYGVEHSAMLKCVMAGALIAVRTTRRFGALAQQNSVVITDQVRLLNPRSGADERRELQV